MYSPSQMDRIVRDFATSISAVELMDESWYSSDISLYVYSSSYQTGKGREYVHVRAVGQYLITRSKLPHTASNIAKRVRDENGS